MSDAPSWRRSRYRRRYGISLEDYERMFFAQGGRCALCGGIDHGRRLAVDHDHSTGKVRGLLCSRCNTGIGSLREDPSLLIRAAAYVASHREVRTVGYEGPCPKARGHAATEEQA